MTSNNFQYQKNPLLSFIMLGTTCLSGCITYDYYSPRIDGIITHNELVLTDVKVILMNYRQVVQTTHTDEKGHFSFAGRGKWSASIMPIGDRFITWSVIIEQDGSNITGYIDWISGGPFTSYSSSDHFMLECDLSRVEKNDNSQDPRPACKLVKRN